MKDYHIGFRMPYQLETLQRFIHEAQQQNINEIAIMEPSVKFFEFAPLYQYFALGNSYLCRCKFAFDKK